MKFIRSNIFKIAELALALVLTIGSFTVFKACPVGEDHVMACHYAQLAVTTIGFVFTIQALAALLITNSKIRLGIAIAQIPLVIAVFFVPGTVFSLCMMSSMRCISIFKPAVRIVSGLSFVVTIADIVLNVVRNKEVKADEHKEAAA